MRIKVKKASILILFICSIGCGIQDIWEDGNDADREDAFYDVHFYYPQYDKWNNPTGARTEYLGEVVGISNCRETASEKAKRLSYDGYLSTGWTYICCLKTPSSICKEKHQ